MKIGIISDIHANPFGLEGVLSQLNFCEYILCAGDITGYSPLVNETIEMLRIHHVITILGNHDYYLLNGCPPSKSAIVKKSVKLTQEIIEPESINFLRSLESMKSIFINDIKIKIAHGSPTDLLEGYVYPDSPVNPEDFRTDEEDILILGHTHYQMIKRFKEYQVINPGSCGQPRDGSLHSGYAILDTLTLNVKLYKSPFDTKEMIKTIIKANWPHELIKYFEGSQI